MYFGLVDIGGTFLKAAVVDMTAGSHGASSLNIIRSEIPGFLNEGGTQRELDPDALMESVCSVIREARIGSAREAPLAGIVISGQMAGLAIVNRSGCAERPLISWQDERCKATDALGSSLGTDTVRRLGEGIRPGLPLVTLSCLEVDQSQFVTSLIGFVAGSLSSNRAHAIHASDAGSWGMLDLQAHSWSDRALQFLKLNRRQLPTVSDQVVMVGKAESFDQAPVFCAVGDQQAALLGSGLGFDEVSVNLATGCQVSMRVGTLEFSPRYQTRPYFDGEYLQTRTHLLAGRLLVDSMVKTYGNADRDAWKQLKHDLEVGSPSAEIATAVSRISEGITGALSVIAPDRQTPVVWSGGLALRVPEIIHRVMMQWSAPHRVALDEDAAVSGLRKIAHAISGTSRKMGGSHSR